MKYFLLVAIFLLSSLNAFGGVNSWTPADGSSTSTPADESSTWTPADGSPTPYRAAAQPQVACAGDVIPAHTVITATGTSSRCLGQCTARQFQRVHGELMVICAHQAIPRGYTIDSYTTTAKCACLGEQDNAYVIRKNERSDDGSSEDGWSDDTSPEKDRFSNGPSDER
jgi:hypothetical protein